MLLPIVRAVLDIVYIIQNYLHCHLIHTFIYHHSIYISISLLNTSSQVIIIAADQSCRHIYIVGTVARIIGEV